VISKPEPTVNPDAGGKKAVTGPFDDEDLPAEAERKEDQDDDITQEEVDDFKSVADALDLPELPEEVMEDLPADEEPDEPRRSARQKASVFSEMGHLKEYVNLVEAEDFLTYREAIGRNDAKEWRKATDKEIGSLEDMGVLGPLQDLPPGKKALRTKWVFKIKKHADGTIDKYKARLTARGDLQREGIDYFDVYAGVVRYNTIRLVLAMSAKYGWTNRQLDVETAFLNSELEEEIYIYQPDGYVTVGQERKVRRLRRALYGLKQAGRAWWKKLNKELKKLEYVPLLSDTNVYVRRGKDDVVILAVYVDDFLMAGSTPKLCDGAEDDLGKVFKVKKLGRPKLLLGITIEYDDEKRTISISQSHYIEYILKRYNMENCKSVATPFDLNEHLTLEDCPKEDDEKDRMRDIPYRRALGCLGFLVSGTRLDIAYHVSELGRFQSNPGFAHWQKLLRVLRFLKGTKDLKITYGPGKEWELTGYSDADWGGERDTRRSTTGYGFTFYGGAISWQSRRQPTVARSSTEAEYMAEGAATCEALWYRSLLKELGFPQEKPTIIRCDNEGAMALAKNPTYHAKTKHIDVQYHFIREKVANGDVRLVYQPTNLMAADMFTKSLGREKIERFRGMLGLA
jgi:hypothetical protein